MSNNEKNAVSQLLQTVLVCEYYKINLLQKNIPGPFTRQTGNPLICSYFLFIYLFFLLHFAWQMQSNAPMKNKLEYIGSNGSKKTYPQVFEYFNVSIAAIIIMISSKYEKNH